MAGRDIRNIDIEHRLTDLESFKESADEEILTLRQEIKDLEKKVAHYDKMALRWGGFAMGALCFSACISMSLDKLREKIIHWWFL